jgi:hypothetical protein
VSFRAAPPRRHRHNRGQPTRPARPAHPARPALRVLGGLAGRRPVPAHAEPGRARRPGAAARRVRDRARVRPLGADAALARLRGDRHPARGARAMGTGAVVVDRGQAGRHGSGDRLYAGLGGRLGPRRDRGHRARCRRGVPDGADRADGQLGLHRHHVGSRHGHLGHEAVGPDPVTQETRAAPCPPACGRARHRCSWSARGRRPAPARRYAAGRRYRGRAPSAARRCCR